MSLIPWQAQAIGAVVAAGAIFAGGAKVEAWRDTGTLDAEKAAHQRAENRADCVGGVSQAICHAVFG